MSIEFYDVNGQETLRAVRLTKNLVEEFRKLFLKAKTAREVHDIQRIIQGDLSIAASMRILDFMGRKTKS